MHDSIHAKEALVLHSPTFGKNSAPKPKSTTMHQNSSMADLDVKKVNFTNHHEKLCIIQAKLEKLVDKIQVAKAEKDDLNASLGEIRQKIKKYSNPQKEINRLNEEQADISVKLSALHIQLVECRKYKFQSWRKTRIEDEVKILRKKLLSMRWKIVKYSLIPWKIKRIEMVRIEKKILNQLRPVKNYLREKRKERKQLKETLEKELLMPRVVVYMKSFGIDYSVIMEMDTDDFTYSYRLNCAIEDAFGKDTYFEEFDFIAREQCGFTPALRDYLKMKHVRKDSNAGTK